MGRNLQKEKEIGNNAKEEKGINLEASPKSKENVMNITNRK